MTHSTPFLAAGLRLVAPTPPPVPSQDDTGRRPDLPPVQHEHPRATVLRAEARAHSRPWTSGRFLVTPLIKVLENGWFATSVSIRSGCGMATSDRVLRLTRIFRSAPEATAYARAEAAQRIAWSARPLAAAA